MQWSKIALAYAQDFWMAFVYGICVVYFEGGGVTLCIFKVLWEGIIC
jgi:hypothetical protein